MIKVAVTDYTFDALDVETSILAPLGCEIAAWKRVNREFMSDLRKQLLLWRTIKPEGQQEYILRGRAHVAGQRLPVEEPGAVVAA